MPVENDSFHYLTFLSLGGPSQGIYIGPIGKYLPWEAFKKASLEGMTPFYREKWAAALREFADELAPFDTSDFD